MRTDKPDHALLDRFNPNMVYRVEKATLKELLLRFGTKIMWNRSYFEIKSKHLGVGVYEIRCKKEEE